jgi:hypothetical protein
MHRRVPLDHVAIYLWQGVSLCISTNSRTILQAATDTGLITMQDSHGLRELCWELTIEEDAAAPGPVCAPKFWRNGQSVYIEIAQRQWFAFDAESGDGTGFLATPAPDLATRACLETILGILGPELHNTSGGTGCNG